MIEKELIPFPCLFILFTAVRNQVNKSVIVAGGSIGQLLATTRHEPRRKLSSISEKSIEMMNGGNQLISVPSSISCPTTTRISKGLIVVWLQW